MRKMEPTNFFKDRIVDIFDSNMSVAKGVQALAARKVTLYSRSEIDFTEGGTLIVRQQLAASAAGLCAADICMLDGDSLGVLAARYPSDPKYVLARLTPRTAWLIGLPGLFRRLAFGWLSINRIMRLVDNNGKASYWLVIARKGELAKKERPFISANGGIESFFAWLQKENVQYVVLRFYEQLPALHREGGDLDLLIADKDREKVIAYIEEAMLAPGAGTAASGVPIGLHSVTEPGGVPYYPPHLARQILERSVAGPAGSRVPSAKDAFHALVYHVLYHYKGYATGIPSELPGRPEQQPENDYGAFIRQKAAQLDVQIGTTMEEMDEYLEEQGWRPKLDLLAKVAKKNAWVHDRFFGNQRVSGSGLAVFILKERALTRGLLEPITRHLEEQGLVIVRSVALDEKQKQHAQDHIRGGNWADIKGSTHGQFPAAIIVGIDMECAHLTGSYVGEFERRRITERKRRLRESFDEAGEASLVHSADTTNEAWDYIETCFPNEMDTIRREVAQATSIPLLQRLRAFLSPSFIAHTLRYKLREMVVRRFIQ